MLGSVRWIVIQLRKLSLLARRRTFHRELEDEMAFHRAEAQREFETDGMAPETARLAVLRQFGNVTRLKEQSHEAVSFRFETVLQDLRFGLRMLTRNTRFTVVAILALALGIGVNTIAFTAYKAIIDRSLDARDSRNMVNITMVRPSGELVSTFSYSDFEEYRQHLHSFSGLIAYNMERLTLTYAGDPISQPDSPLTAMMGSFGLLSSGISGSSTELAVTAFVSENYFSVLGVTPILGRGFEASNQSALLAAPAVMISENYWRRRFAGDPSLVGRLIRLNDVPVTVIGITPHDFVGTAITVPDFWLPLTLEPLVHPGDNWLRDRESQCCRLFGLLGPGVRVEQAQAEMQPLADHLRAVHKPHSELSKPASVQLLPGSPFPRKLDPGLKFAIFLIMAAVGMVLVVACANVASLQLARTAARENELSMRLSLGASRGRLLRQLLTESALTGVIAGIVALSFTSAMLRVVVHLIADAIPAEYGTLILHVNPDLQIFLYVFGISLLAGVFFGLAPALQTTRSVSSSGFKSGSGTVSVHSRRLRDLLISAQVAVSLVLMIAGSLLVRSSIHTLTMETGYDCKNVIALELQFPEESAYASERKAALAQELRTRISGLPGVASVTAGRAPDASGIRTAAISLNGKEPTIQNSKALIYYTYVGPGYFDALGIPLLFGHSFSSQNGQSDHSVILSESAAMQLWPGESPLGKTLRLGTEGQFHNKDEVVPDGPTYQVIGVARDTRGVELDGSDSEQIYVLLPSNRTQDFPILIRTQAAAVDYKKAIGGMVSSTDGNLVAYARTLEEMLHQTPPFIVSTLAATLASTVGIVGLLLATMGIYGTVSYMVVLRTREVGVRIALGATKRDILSLMLRESAKPVVTGLLTGILLAMGASYLLRGILYGLGPLDAFSFAGVSALFLAIALLAAYAPSRRALRIEPVEALRCE